MENYFLRDPDKKQFEQKILPNIKKGKPAYIYTAFTYIKPNYSIILFLQELLKLTKKHDLKVILVVWDMSVIANNYYRKMKKEVSDTQFIEDITDELYKICYSLGFREDSISIYKSSDLWKRFISYKDEDIYQGFYSTLVQLRVQEYALNYKAAYLVQMPLNLFFCNYFHKLFPEDVERKIELTFIEEQREKLYTHARGVMYDLGITTYESPAFVIMEDIPYFNHNDYEPEWNMSFADVHEIISNIKPSKVEILRVCSLLGADRPDPSQSEEETYGYLANKIYSYLQERKKACEILAGNMENRIMDIDNKKDLLKFGSILRSEIAVDILLEADGKKNLSKIARNLKKSIPTISTYVKKLRALKLIRIQDDGTLKRTIKGFKANLELGF
jgi:DNA-binding transcriptional ArsR family regulator